MAIDPGLVAVKAESGSPYAVLGFGPRIKRYTPWDPERWKRQRDPLRAGLPPVTRETKRFHTWNDQGNPSLTEAYFYARSLAWGALPSFESFLVLAGPRGVGKTHLALSVAWEWFEDGHSVLFTRVDDLLDELRRAYGDGSYYRKLDFVLECQLLVLDDLGTEHVKDWAGEKIDRIVDWRYLREMDTVVTTNARGDDLAPRVASRLSDSRCSAVVQIEAEDYRTEAGGDRWTNKH